MNWCKYTKSMRKLQITSQTACSCNSANPKSSQCGIPGHAVTLLIRKWANVESLVVEQNSCAFCKTPNHLHLSKPTVRESSLHSKSAWILWVLFRSIARQSILVQEPMRKRGQSYTNASIIGNSLFSWITMSPQCALTLDEPTGRPKPSNSGPTMQSWRRCRGAHQNYVEEITEAEGLPGPLSLARMI